MNTTKLLLLLTFTVFIAVSIFQVQPVQAGHNYVLQGLRDETTGAMLDPSERAINITAYFNDNSSFTFEMNGSYTYQPSSKPEYFMFELGSRDRQFWVATADNNSIIEVFNQTLTTYTVQFLDLAGVLDDYPFISFNRNINGSLRTLEKRKIDSEKKVIANLMQGEKYTINIENGAGYTYGEVLFSSETSVTLTVKGIEFPQNIVLGYRYCRTYAIRLSNQTRIATRYEDTQGDLANVTVTILHSNGTQMAQQTYINTAGFFYFWSNAIYNETYRVQVVIDHSRYGLMYYNNQFQRAWSTSPWSFPIGTIPNFDMVNLVPLACIFAGVVIFSKVNAPLGAFAGTVMAIIMYWIGWTNPANHATYTGLLVAALTFTILYGLAHAKRKEATNL